MRKSAPDLWKPGAGKCHALRLNDIKVQAELYHAVAQLPVESLVALYGDQLCNQVRVLGGDGQNTCPAGGDGEGRLVGLLAGVVQQYAVMDFQQVVLVVRQDQIYQEGFVSKLFGIRHDAHVVQGVLGAHALGGGTGTHDFRGGIQVRTVAQLKGTDQVGVPPGTGLRLIAQLLQRVGAEVAGLGVFGVRVDQGVGNLGNPLIFALFIVLPRQLQDLVRVA